jgi:invasion protein IalB
MLIDKNFVKEKTLYMFVEFLKKITYVRTLLIKKYALYICLFLFSFMTSAFSQINTTAWIKNCIKDANNKENCSIAIKNEVEDKDKKKLTLSTVFVLRGEENVNSKDKDGKTITTKKPAVVFVANLPLNVDLTIKPQLQIDGKKVIDLTLTNCNQNEGCKAIGSLSNESIEKMKKGKILSVITRSFGSPQNIKIDFPLKDFDSEFKKI